MLDLPSVTLFCADCVNAERARIAMEYCRSKCTFGATKLLTSLPTDYKFRVEIQNLPTLVDYSVFMLKRAVLHVNTRHVLVVQHDGFIINPEAWDPNWLNYDYIGPLFIQDHPDMRVGSGGFSLRSRALMEFVCRHAPDWDGSPESAARAQGAMGVYEDGFICHALRNELSSAGFKIAPTDVAERFAQGGWPQAWSPSRDDRSHYVERPFGFHGGWGNVDWITGFVSPPPFSISETDKSIELRDHVSRICWESR